MGKRLRLMRVLLRDTFRSGMLFAAILLTAFVCAGGKSLHTADGSCSLIACMLQRETYRSAKLFPMNTPAILMQGFDASPWFAVTLPVLAAIPTVRTWQQFTGTLRRSLLCRTDRKCYRRALFCWLYLCGCMTVFCGLTVYFLLLHSYFPLAGMQRTELAPIVHRLVNTVLIGGVFPVIAALLLTLLHDTFLAVTLPMMLQYLSMKCCILYDEWVYDLSANRWESKPLLFLRMLFPSNCCMWEGSGLPFALFFVVHAGVLSVLYFAFAHALEGKVQDRL